MQGDRSERDLAKAAATAKLHTWRSKSRLEQKQKLAQFLMRRGFSSDVIWGVVDDVVSNV
jgi:SOS response regulatory protein OraA/RecX